MKYDIDEPKNITKGERTSQKTTRRVIPLTPV